MKRNAQALNLIDAGNCATAIELFGISVDRDPDSTFTYQLRAGAHQ